MTAAADRRVLSVPDGLAGERVDAAGLILLLAFRGIRIDGGRSTTKSEPQPEPESDR